MKKNSSIILITLVILALLVVIFILFNNFNTPSVGGIGFDVYIFGERLEIGRDNLIITDTLVPTIEIKGEKTNDISSISLDEEPNILEEKLSLVEVSRDSRILIKSSYAFTPTKHTIKLEDKEGKNYEFSYILIIKDDFKETLNLSKLWIIPDSTKNNYEKSWYVSGGSLKIDKLPESPRASLAFLYTFNKDVTIDFSFKSSSEIINFLTYFLESGKSIIIGNGDNYKTAILCGNKSERGKNFIIEEGNQYRIRVIRDGDAYKLFIKKIDGNYNLDIDNIKNIFSGNDLIAEFIDSNPFVVDDHVGFTVWGGGGDLEIRNFIITGYAIY